MQTQCMPRDGMPRGRTCLAWPPFSKTSIRALMTLREGSSSAICISRYTSTARCQSPRLPSCAREQRMFRIVSALVHTIDESGMPSQSDSKFPGTERKHVLASDIVFRQAREIGAREIGAGLSVWPPLAQRCPFSGELPPAIGHDGRFWEGRRGWETRHLLDEGAVVCKGGREAGTVHAAQ